MWTLGLQGSDSSPSAGAGLAGSESGGVSGVGWEVRQLPSQHEASLGGSSHPWTLVLLVPAWAAADTPLHSQQPWTRGQAVSTPAYAGWNEAMNPSSALQMHLLPGADPEPGRASMKEGGGGTQLEML